MSTVDDSFLIDIEFTSGMKASPSGDIQLIKGQDNLKQALFNCLITIPGSLAHRPSYGVGVKRWQNDIGSISRQQALAVEIKRQFEKDDRVEKVTSVQILLDPIRNGLFTVRYKVKAVAVGELEDTVNPFGDIIV
jgi:phage baseplate assembly protein W